MAQQIELIENQQRGRVAAAVDAVELAVIEHVRGAGARHDFSCQQLERCLSNHAPAAATARRSAAADARGRQRLRELGSVTRRQIDFRSGICIRTRDTKIMLALAQTPKNRHRSRR
jgi:hypothetical protein